MGKAPNPEAADRAGRVELILSQLESLPTLPAVAVRLVQLTTDKNANAKQIVSLIESDAALTAKILKLARRADSGIRPDAARTVERVVVMLGFDTVRNAVLSIKVFETFGPDAGRAGAGSFDRQDFWRHSLAVGCAAKLLAERMGRQIDPEEAFVCGLLHDLGKAALDAILPKSYGRVIEAAKLERIAIADAESRLLGVDHTIVGKRLGTRWGLPESIIATMWLHHQDPELLPRAVPGTEYARLVYLADLIVREHRLGFSGNPVLPQPARDLARRLGVVEADYQRVLQGLPEAIEQRAEVLGLQRVTRNTLFLKALAEANEELGKVNEALDRANRQLQRRSRYFDVLAQLAHDLGASRDLAAHASACAKALHQALSCEAAVIAVEQRSGLCAVGYCAGGRIGEYWGRLEGHQAGEPAESPERPVARFRPRPLAADDPLLRACEEHLPGGSAWLVELLAAAGWRCVAVLIAPPERAQPWEADEAELDGLHASLSLALLRAAAAQRAEELSEALAEQARRQHEAEPQRLRARSIDMIAEMAAGAGHEMNNPLAIIAGRAQLLQGKITDSDNAQALETIVQQAQRCSQIVSDLMDFARPVPPDPVRIDLRGLVPENVRAWVQQASLRPEQVVLDVPDDLPAVRFDAAHLARILREILDNSLQAAGEDSGGLRINCRAKASDESVVLAVSDNGPGMRPEVLVKALLPFFSYRPAGRRRGLGLSRAYRLAELNSGDLWLESRPQEGTTVYLRLPIAETNA